MRLRALLLAGLLVLVGACDRSESNGSQSGESAGTASQGASDESGGASAGPDGTYHGICSYTVTNEAGVRIVEADFRYDGQTLTGFTIENRSGKKILETLRYEIAERKGRETTLEVYRDGADSPSGRRFLKDVEGHNLAKLSKPSDEGGRQPIFASAYSQDPLELLAAGPVFPLARSDRRREVSYRDDGRVETATVDRNGDGNADATVQYRYDGGLLTTIDLAQGEAEATYIEADYRDGRLQSMSTDVDLDGIPEEQLEASYDCWSD